MSLTQYLKDTRAELNHVAWPSQTQTIVFTVLVIGVSVFIALYIGLFDFLFTNTMKRFVEAKTGTAPQAQAIDIATTTATT